MASSILALADPVSVAAAERHPAADVVESDLELAAQQPNHVRL